MHWRTVLWIDCFSVQGKGGFIRGLFLFCFFFGSFSSLTGTPVLIHISVLLTSIQLGSLCACLPRYTTFGW